MVRRNTAPEHFSLAALSELTVICKRSSSVLFLIIFAL